jgi:hypothetical protein
MMMPGAVPIPPPMGGQPPNAPVSAPNAMPVSSVPVSGGQLPVAPVSAPVAGQVSPAAFQSATTPQSPPTSGPPNGTAVFGAAPPAPIAPPYGPPGRPLPPPRPGGSGRPLAVVAIAVVVIVLLIGVGGVVAWRAVSDDKPTDNGTSGPRNVGDGGTSTADAGSGGQAANTANAKPGAAQQSVAVNKSVWYAQFKITVNKVTYDSKATSDQLSSEVIVENLGPNNASPYIPTVFSVGGQQYTGSFRESTQVSAGQKSNYNIDFSVYDPLKASIATGEFIFGDGDREQPKIPLGGGAVVAYEPSNLVKDKKVTAHDVTATFTTCDLRGAFFDYNGQAKKGYRVVMCKVDIQYTGKSSKYVGEEHFRLGQPDGTEIGPLTAPNEALSGGQVAVATDLAFQVKIDLVGTYKLRLVDLGDHKDRQAGDVAEVDLVLK